MPNLTPDRVRNLYRSDLGMIEPSDSAEIAMSVDPDVPEGLSYDHPVFASVREALELRFAGVILVGPPGTGKSWLAKHLALAIAQGDNDAVRFVQFHASYQYEDFMEGYAPSPNGIESILKVFPKLCKAAEGKSATTHVLVIDEISRCDAARVFGEALTYLEVDKRGFPFILASGREMTVPPNVIVIATMNPWDRGVDQIDVALERRFAHIEIPPSAAELRSILQLRGAVPQTVDRVVAFFEKVQALDDEQCRLGHAYFIECIDDDAAEQIWRLQLRPFFRRACRLDPTLFKTIEQLWNEAIHSMALAEPAAPEQAAGGNA